VRTGGEEREGRRGREGEDFGAHPSHRGGERGARRRDRGWSEGPVVLATAAGGPGEMPLRPRASSTEGALQPHVTPVNGAG
jgi:hypothetical protein